MNPSHIYFKDLDINEDKTFTLNFAKENETENVIFDKSNEYAVTSMKIKANLPDSKIIKISDEEKQDKVSKEIQKLVKNYKEPDLTFTIFNRETKTKKIPFIKKNEADLPRIKITYFNTTLKKTEELKIHYCFQHFKTYGFKWEEKTSKFKYEIKLVSGKIEKKTTVDKL